MKTIYLMLIGMVYAVSLPAQDAISIKIRPDLDAFYTYHKGVKIRVMRIQDPQNRLNDDYTKTSRECPPFCIHPVKAADGVETIGEIELIDAIKNPHSNTLLIDARLSDWYQLETIPSAINIPYTLFESNDKKAQKKILKLLGMGENGDFKKAKTLILFCNGVWCDQSPRLIKRLLSWGYPADKLKYYRDGFQGWKLLGLTTVVEKENKK